MAGFGATWRYTSRNGAVERALEGAQERDERWAGLTGHWKKTLKRGIRAPPQGEKIF